LFLIIWMIKGWKIICKFHTSPIVVLHNLRNCVSSPCKLKLSYICLFIHSQIMVPIAARLCEKMNFKIKFEWYFKTIHLFYVKFSHVKYVYVRGQKNFMWTKQNKFDNLEHISFSYDNIYGICKCLSTSTILLFWFVATSFMLNFHTLNITYSKYMTISICMGLKHRYGGYVEPQSGCHYHEVHFFT
jgi:hypothetical protein